MTSLAQRLQKIQKTTEESRSDQQQLSLGQLREQKISFGKTHQGKTFLKMWKEEQGWITWFVQRFAQSTKIEHQSFLRYVELEIEQAELKSDDWKKATVNSSWAARASRSGARIAHLQSSPPFRLGSTVTP